MIVEKIQLFDVENPEGVKLFFMNQLIKIPSGLQVC